MSDIKIALACMAPVVTTKPGWTNNGRQEVLWKCVALGCTLYGKSYVNIHALGTTWNVQLFQK